MKKFATITALVLISILYFQNLEPGKIKVFFWQFEFSIGFWILLVFLSGLILGYFLGYFGKSKKAKAPELEFEKEEDEDGEFLRP